MGDEVTITTPDETKTVVAQFDPEDHMTERKVQVDFGVPPTESASGSMATLWVYGAGIALAIAAFLYWRVSARKKAKAHSQGWKKVKKK
jgi:hypothetical protein